MFGNSACSWMILGRIFVILMILDRIRMIVLILNQILMILWISLYLNGSLSFCHKILSKTFLIILITIQSCLTWIINCINRVVMYMIWAISYSPISISSTSLDTLVFNIFLGQFKSCYFVRLRYSLFKFQVFSFMIDILYWINLLKFFLE